MLLYLCGMLITSPILYNLSLRVALTWVYPLKRSLVRTEPSPLLCPFAAVVMHWLTLFFFLLAILFLRYRGTKYPGIQLGGYFASLLGLLLLETSLSPFFQR